MNLHLREENMLTRDEINRLLYDIKSLPHAVFTQSDWYGKIHEKQGRYVQRLFVMDSGGKLFGYMQIVLFEMPFSLFYYYSPYGPIILDKYDEVLSLFKNYLEDVSMQNKKIIFSRMEFSPEIDKAILKKAGFRKISRSASKGSAIQPRNEWEIDVTQSEEELLSNTHKKTRYCIRQAEKEGIEVLIIERETRAFGKTLYQILKETAKRNKFYLHKKEYYDAVLEAIDRERVGYLAVGLYKEEVVTMHVVFTYGDTASYVYGGTIDAYRNIPSSHLVEWRSIFHAKSRGLSYYNMGGISTEDSPNKHLDAVTRFKKRFGGYVRRHDVLYDKIHRPLWYYLYILRKIISF